MKKEELRVIPKKNYIILGIILIISFLLIYYLYMWVDAYNETKLNKPILDKYMEVINYNELDDYIVESPNAIIYVSALENKEIREFEKKFKSLLKTNKIVNEVLYMDITEELKNKKIVEDFSNRYYINGLSVNKLPLVLIIDNGNLKMVYDVRNNNFDIQMFEYFINNVSFSGEGEIND